MIVLLICDQFPGILPPDIPSYERMFERVFLQADKGCRFRVFQTWKGALPANLNKDDIYLVSGSNNSAYDDVEWVVRLREWIRAAYRSGCRLTGICFGHQIIAEALGGKVVRSPKGWGIGLRTSVIQDAEFLSVAGDKQFVLQYDHHDQVVRLPEEAVLVSGSDFCPADSFRIGSQVLTFQGHPEFSNAFITHWVNDCAPDEPAAVKEAALGSMKTLDNEGVKVAGWILQWFNQRREI